MVRVGSRLSLFFTVCLARTELWQCTLSVRSTYSNGISDAPGDDTRPSALGDGQPAARHSSPEFMAFLADPGAGLHLTGLAAVASVHNATLSKPVKQESPTETFPPKSELWTPLTSSYGLLLFAAFVARLRRCHVHRGILLEETGGFEHKASIRDWHHRPVLGPWNMVHAE
jgi:hypothetical protein